MTAAEGISLVQATIWPAFALALVVFFRRPLLSLFSAVENRVNSGAKVTTAWISFDAPPSNLKSPAGDAPVTENHLVIVHSSWRYPKKDAEYNRTMYAFHVIIQATDDVLDRIESVRYSLHPSYPNPIRVVTDRASRFKLKDLAWGETNVRAEVLVKGQQQPIKLNRYINLTQTGPRI